ncbi:MAG: tRNA pseudouridine(13) synthase TruD [Gammaproteobacteria bacterium]
MSQSEDRRDRSDLPGSPALAYPDLHIQAEMRSQPTDFEVSEQLGFELTGKGEHCFLRIRKTDCNTMWVVRILGQAARVHPRDIGYSGLKDRRARTDQWFSLPAAKAANLDAETLRQANLEVLEQELHAKKLRRGSHSANRFRIVLRAMHGDLSGVEQRMLTIAEHGVPNYFGTQRFGRDCGNLQLAEALASGKRLRRAERGFALSAARALIFNEVLSKRVALGSWSHLSAGDLAGLAGSRSYFAVAAVDAEIQDRLVRGDIHPTGPLWGKGRLGTGAGIRDIELGVAEQFPVFAECLARLGLDHERRYLRLIPEDLDWQLENVDDACNLVVSFSLPAGCFATSVLREILVARDKQLD